MRRGAVLSMAVAAWLLGVMAAPAGAQSTFKVPFKFESGGTRFAAGDYVWGSLVTVISFANKAWSDSNPTAAVLPGDVIGFRSALAEEPYSTTAKTVSEVRACVVPHAVFVGTVRRSHDFCGEILRRLSVELRIAEELLLNLTQRSVQWRAANLLLALLGENAGIPGEQKISGHLSRSEMAQLIGSSLESCSRMLSELDEAGILDVSRSRVIVKDVSALQRIVRSKQ